MDEGTTATLASPTLEHIIERPRLIGLLEDSGARVVLLVAPAGYGKTTLARQWSARQSGPVAWHRTTRASGDVAALAVDLDNVLAAATEPSGRDPKRIGSIATVNPRPAPLAHALVSTYAHLTEDVLLVLDEWEAAGTDEAEELMTTVVDELAIRVLATSRTRPPWFTSRLTVYGEGLELGLRHLAMSDEEARRVLATNRRGDDPQAVIASARGWPAVIGLAAMNTQAEMPSDEMSRTLHKFLAEELLAATPDDITDALELLVAAAISEPTTARLVLGERTDTALTEAATRGLLAIDAGGAVSVHPLVRDLLEVSLTGRSRTSSAELATRLRPLIAAGRWDEALAAAEILRDRGFVTEALLTGLDDLLRHRGADTLRRWVEIGRAVEVDQTLAAYVESELTLRLGEFDRSLMLAAGAAPRLEGDMAARAHIAAGTAAYLGDRGATGDPHIAAGLKLGQHRTTRRAAKWLKFARILEEEGHDAAAALSDFEAEANGETEVVLRAAQGRLHLGLLEGGLPDQLDWAEVAAALLTREVDALTRTSFLNAYSNALGAAACYRLSLSTADEELKLADEHGLAFVRAHALVNRARSLIGLRRFAQARRTLIQLDRTSNTDTTCYFRAHHAIQTAGLYVSIGDPQRALAALALDPGPTGKTFRAEFLATRALAQAATHDAGALRSAADAERLSRSIEVRALVAVTRAIAALADHDEPRSFAEIRTAVSTHAMHGIVLGLRTSLPMAEQMASGQEHREVLVRLFEETGDAALARRVGVSVPRSPVRSQLLSPRESEIHGLIAQGMTNPEIARLLFISESTTKVHVRHILAKLGVKSRAEAVAVWPGADEGAMEGS